VRNCVGELAFGSFIDVLVTTAAELGAGAAQQGDTRCAELVPQRIKPKPAYPTKRL
jgi:hypothetical protein